MYLYFPFLGVFPQLVMFFTIEYHRVNDRIAWDIANTHLPDLEKAICWLLQQPGIKPRSL
ncbi:hypothetical protein WA1_50430 [Scytonema hofmannii PCC 7110]|uniref:Uncharacterized protein n=2 Tax=Scytonema hofmannii TaxID=34078 RepID=A0A139WQD2_9CYAN|nr:hypothetical protein WA1_50430 [Scytonema hofmannii PCC 7110]